MTTAAALYGLARVRRFACAPVGGRRPGRVVHVSPCYFDDSSIIGGGERYAQSLAGAMSDLVECVMVSFGPERKTFRQGRLKFEIYPRLELINGVAFDPLCYGFLRELTRADVVHCHQYRTAVSNLAILGAKALGKRVFVSDYGCAATHFSRRLDPAHLVDGFLPISARSARSLPSHPSVRVIFGGVDEKYVSRQPPEQREPKVVCVARIMPHKGTNYLVEGLDPRTRLEVIGRPYHADFYALLQRLAGGKQVRFITQASDDEVLAAYSTASVAVLPSVYEDVYGDRWPEPELLGLVLLEAMARATPVVCTNVGGMPEMVEDGVTGFVVPPNDARALGERVGYLMANPERARAMGREGRRRVLERFTWRGVAERCLESYVDPEWPDTAGRTLAV
jgi:glycosyltransferase involved in cell wall biosynthesis